MLKRFGSGICNKPLASILTSAAIFLAFAAAPRAGFFPNDYKKRPFEGVLHFSERSHGRPSSFDYSSKGPVIRIDRSASLMAPAIMIARPAQGAATLVMPETRSYYEVRFSTKPTVDSVKAFDIKRTTRHREILGMQCEEVEAAGPETTISIWAAPLAIRFMAMPKSYREIPPPPAWVTALNDWKLFPLSIVEKDSAGRVTRELNVTSIEQRSLKDGLFQVPSGFVEKPVSRERR